METIKEYIRKTEQAIKEAEKVVMEYELKKESVKDNKQENETLDLYNDHKISKETMNKLMKETKLFKEELKELEPTVNDILNKIKKLKGILVDYKKKNSYNNFDSDG